MNRRYVLIAAILLVALGMTGLMMWWAARTARNVITTATKPHEETIDLGAIVTKVRGLQRLETASMEVMQVSTTKQSYNYVPDAIAGDELQFLAVGQVIAGVDLDRLQPNDVRREGNRVIVRIPSSEILVSRIDNRRSHVMNRSTGVMRRGDIEMEGRARQNAEVAIRNEALRKGILDLASRNAAQRVAELLHRTGVNEVIVEESRGTTTTIKVPQETTPPR